MIARATGRAPLLAVKNRIRRIRSLFVMAEKKQKATPDRAVKHKYPLEVCSLCLDSPQGLGMSQNYLIKHIRA